MYLEQLSVFMENKVSRLNEVLLQLKTSKVNVLSLSLADTSEFGVLRLIVDNPEEGRKVLKENGFSAEAVASHVSERELIVIIVCHSAEKSLAASQHFIVDVLLSVVAAFDKNGVVVYFNNTAAF